jgi:hypothetical protein
LKSHKKEKAAIMSAVAATPIEVKVRRTRKLRIEAMRNCPMLCLFSKETITDTAHGLERAVSKRFIYFAA